MAGPQERHERKSADYRSGYGQAKVDMRAEIEHALRILDGHGAPEMIGDEEDGTLALQFRMRRETLIWVRAMFKRLKA